MPTRSGNVIYSMHDHSCLYDHEVHLPQQNTINQASVLEICSDDEDGNRSPGRYLVDTSIESNHCYDINAELKFSFEENSIKKGIRKSDSYYSETSYYNDSTTSATFLSYDEGYSSSSSVLYEDKSLRNSTFTDTYYNSDEDLSVISGGRCNNSDCVCIDVVNNQIDHKTDLFGKYFVDGIINLVFPSSNNVQLDFAVDDTLYEEVAMSAIICKYISKLIGKDDDLAFSLDYDGIIDKMDVDIDFDMQIIHVNLFIPLGFIVKETNAGCCIGHILKSSNNNDIEVGDQIIAINGINTCKKSRMETNSIIKNEFYHEKQPLQLSLLRYHIADDDREELLIKLKPLFKREKNKVKNNRKFVLNKISHNQKQIMTVIGSYFHVNHQLIQLKEHKKFSDTLLDGSVAQLNFRHSEVAEKEQNVDDKNDPSEVSTDDKLSDHHEQEVCKITTEEITNEGNVEVSVLSQRHSKNDVESDYYDVSSNAKDCYDNMNNDDDNITYVDNVEVQKDETHHIDEEREQAKGHDKLALNVDVEPQIDLFDTIQKPKIHQSISHVDIDNTTINTISQEEKLFDATVGDDRMDKVSRSSKKIEIKCEENKSISDDNIQNHDNSFCSNNATPSIANNTTVTDDSFVKIINSAKELINNTTISSNDSFIDSNMSNEFPLESTQEHVDVDFLIDVNENADYYYCNNSNSNNDNNDNNEEDDSYHKNYDGTESLLYKEDHKTMINNSSLKLSQSSSTDLSLSYQSIKSNSSKATSSISSKSSVSSEKSHKKMKSIDTNSTCSDNAIKKDAKKKRKKKSKEGKSKSVGIPASPKSNRILLPPQQNSGRKKSMTTLLSLRKETKYQAMD